MGSLHIVIPTVGRPTCASVVRAALEREEHLTRLTVVNQGHARIADCELHSTARRRGVHLQEIMLPAAVGPGRARHIGAVQGEEDFVGFLDDDIAFERGSLSALVDRCERDALGGAAGVLATPETRPLARLAKTILFQSIFRDRRQWAISCREPQEAALLSGGMTVYRRALYLGCASAWTACPPFLYGEDVELSFQISRRARLVLDPSVRVHNRHVQLSLGPPDRSSRALARLERYRSFADRHASTRRHWIAYLGVLVCVLARGARQERPLPFVRAVTAEARRAARRAWQAGAWRVGPASVADGGRAPQPCRTPRPTVAAITVFFHSEQVIEECVQALLDGHRRPDVVAVVANSPVPAPLAERLQRLGARVLESQVNAGFAAACNRAAAAVDSDFLWFVNPDVACDPTCLERLMAWATSDVVLAPVLYDGAGTSQPLGKTSTYLSPWLLLAREAGIGRWFRLGHATARRPQPPAAVSGACLLVPRAAFRSVNGFDERYFLYGEDVDLCLRLGAAGLRVRVAGDAVATHRPGTSCGSPPPPGVSQIKGREARRSHYLLLDRFRSPAAARRYVRGLAWVLRARLTVAWLVRSSTWVQDRAAYEWALAQARTGP